MSDLTLRQHLEAAEAALADAAVRDGHKPSMDAVGHIMAAQAILGDAKRGPVPSRWGPGEICSCGHTLGCNCGKCPHCIRDTSGPNPLSPFGV